MCKNAKRSAKRKQSMFAFNDLFFFSSFLLLVSPFVVVVVGYGPEMRDLNTPQWDRDGLTHVVATTKKHLGSGKMSIRSGSII